MKSAAAVEAKVFTTHILKFPAGYFLRRWGLRAVEIFTDTIGPFPSLPEARGIIPASAVMSEPTREDHPAICEVWRH